jgi:hypothetical protein
MFFLINATSQCEGYPPRVGGPPYPTSDHWRQLVRLPRCPRREGARSPLQDVNAGERDKVQRRDYGVRTILLRCPVF